MGIPSYDGRKEGNFATFELVPLNGHLSYSSLFKVCFLSYSKFGSTTSTSKVATNSTPMVVTVVWGFVKCKFRAAL